MEVKRKRSLWQKIDNPILGFVLGLIIPFVTYFVIYFVQYGHLRFSDFWDVSLMKNTAPILLRTMVFPNLILFLFGNIFKKFLFCRGIFYASILFVIPMLTIKYL